MKGILCRVCIATFLTQIHAFVGTKVHTKLSRIVLQSSSVTNENNRPGHEEIVIPKLKKSLETSNFWYSDAERNPLTPDQVLPCQFELDNEGPLPFGSYRVLGKKDFDPKEICLVTASLGIRNVDRSAIDTGFMVSNAQKMIDSGMNSFELGIDLNSKKAKKNKRSSGLEPDRDQAWMEQNLYRKLVKDTPSSVLSRCSIGTRLNIPHWDYDGYIGQGSIIRQQIGESLMNIYGTTGSCLDSIRVNYRSGKKTGTMSPYTMDVLSVLHDMQREGFVRSINGSNFPVKVLEELKSYGFNFDSNEISCNILDPNDQYAEMQNFCKNSARDGINTKVTMSSPLAGGLLTNNFYGMPHRNRLANGSPYTQYMSQSEQYCHTRLVQDVWRGKRNSFERNRITRNDSWMAFEQKVLKCMHDISVKHKVDIASVAIRWSMQHEHIGSTMVGTCLNARFDNGVPFTRPKQLRKAFSLHLDEEDMERLWRISGGKPEITPEIDFHQFDLSDRTLWL